MKLRASGRDSDVYDYAEGLVLRRYRDCRSAEAEAETIRDWPFADENSPDHLSAPS